MKMAGKCVEMITNGRGRFRLTAILVASILIFCCCAPVFTSTVTAANNTKDIQFDLVSPEFALQAQMKVRASYTSSLLSSPGETEQLSYSIIPLDCTFTMRIPFSNLGIGIEDRTVTIPIPLTPLGTVDMPLLNVNQIPGLQGLPSSIAGINLKLSGSVQGTQQADGNGVTLSSHDYKMSWISAGTRFADISVQGAEAVRLALHYSLAISLTIAFLTIFEQTLIGPNEVFTSNTDSSIATSIYMPALPPQGQTGSVDLGSSFPVASIVLILLAAIVIAVVSVFIWRRGRPMAPDTNELPPLSVCGACGQQLASEDTICSECGKER